MENHIPFLRNVVYVEQATLLATKQSLLRSSIVAATAMENMRTTPNQSVCQEIQARADGSTGSVRAVEKHAAQLCGACSSKGNHSLKACASIMAQDSK